MAFLANRKQQLTDNIKTEMKRMRNVKWYASVTVKMTKYSPEGDIRDRAQPSFNSVSQTVISYEDIPAQIDAAIFKICDNLEKFSRDGSGWRLDDILLMVQTVLRYRVVRGSCSDYVLPKRLKRKACVLSVVGAPRNSAECFKYAVLAGMFAPSDRTGEIHWSELKQHQNLLNFSGIENTGKRMSLAQVRDFEKNNNMSINIFGYTDSHISKNLDVNTKTHVNLLLVSYSEDEIDHGESDGHYCLIQDISRLFHDKETMRHGRSYYCMRCLNPKSRSV